MQKGLTWNAGYVVLSRGTPGAHKIRGIGAGFVSDTLNTYVYDEIITVENEDAFAIGRVLAREDGVIIGIPPVRLLADIAEAALNHL